jgi:hypothetical protein
MNGTVIPAVGALFAVGCAISLISYLKRVLDAEEHEVEEIWH